MSAPLNKMKMIRLIQLHLLLIIAAVLSPAVSAQSRISFSPYQSVASVGDTIEINIAIEPGVIDLFAYTTHVKFDTSMLQIIDAFPTNEWLTISGTDQYFVGADSLEINPETNEPNWYFHVFDVLFTNPKSTINGYAEIATLQFEVMQPGISQIYYEFYKGSDTLLQSIINNSGIGLIYVCPLPMSVGDLDGSGFIDIADLVYFVEFSFNGGPPPAFLLAADLNCDVVVDIADIVYMVEFMFGGGPAPCNPCE